VYYGTPQRFYSVDSGEGAKAPGVNRCGGGGWGVYKVQCITFSLTPVKIVSSFFNRVMYRICHQIFTLTAISAAGLSVLGVSIFDDCSAK